ncbi:MAG: PAS domain S-box protein, partial [Bacteroidales bacterium]
MSPSLEVLFDNAADAIIIAEKTSGIILDANKAASRLLQLPHEKIVGMHQSKLHPKNDTSSFNNHVKDLDELGATVAHDEKIVRKDGSEIPVEILASQIVYDGKQCIMGTFRDISLRKQTEKVLKESEDEFKSVIQSSPNAFYIYHLENDNRLILTATNPAADKIIGISHKSLIGKTIEEAFPNLISTGIPDIYRKIARGEMNNYSFEIPYQDERFKGYYNVHVYATKANTIVVDFRDITERFMNEKKLRDSQLLLKSSLESQKDTILFSIDNAYRYLYFNKAHIDVMKYAYNKDIELGMNILDCITLDDDREVAKENYDRALKGESHTNIRVYGERNVAYYESFFNPILSDENEIVGATGLARDITERKKTEQELQDMSQRLKLATDSGKLGIWDRDLEKNTMKWNERMFELYGITQDTFSNNVDAWINGLHPEDKQRAVEESNLAIAGDKNFDTTFRVLHPNGTVKYLKAYAVVIRDNSGKALWMTGISRDITEQIQAEHALKESEEKSRLLIKNSNDIIVLVNEKGEQTFVSDVVENITGYTAEELYGNILDVIHP